MDQILLTFFIFFYFSISIIKAQQNYSGNSILDCKSSDETSPSPNFLYTCNGENSSCRAFLIFRSQPPYNSVVTISNFTSSDPLELARINNVSMVTIFPTYKEVIVPINCSCLGHNYQANSSYVMSFDENYYTIANNTYQGLSSCNSLMEENPYDRYNLIPGSELRVPLRCACPTSNQIVDGTKYLLTYSITWNDSVDGISERFNVNRASILEANGFSEYDPTIFPFTALLIPLPSEPSSTQTIIPVPPLIISPPNVPNPRTKKSKKGLYVSIGIASISSLLVLLCIVLTIAFLCQKRKLDRTKGRKKWVLPKDFLVRIARADRVLKVFEFEELKIATNNFSPESKMKGLVYRGVLSGEGGEVVVAIKKMSNDVSKEVKFLNKIHHFNLIGLHGVCEDNGYFYLVYEYMEYGCLRNWLRNKSCPMISSWTRRIQIALDVANGLHYLHNFTNPAYVHKNIKSSNVLLNGDLRAKIANFGLASLTERSDDVSASSRLVGTKGYMAPEYLEIGLATPKIDVYAFGVVMLELITGRDPLMKFDGKKLLSASIMSIMEGEELEDKLCDVMDPNLRENYPMDLALGVAKLSVGCLKRDPMSRPSMDEVVSTLVRIHSDSLKWESPYVELVESSIRYPAKLEKI